MIRLIVVLLMYFLRLMSMALVLLGFKDKIILHYFREVKCQQSYIQEFDIRNKLFYDSTTEFGSGNQDRFPGGQNNYLIFNPEICGLSVQNQWGERQKA